MKIILRSITFPSKCSPTVLFNCKLRTGNVRSRLNYSLLSLYLVRFIETRGIVHRGLFKLEGIFYLWLRSNKIIDKDRRFHI